MHLSDKNGIISFYIFIVYVIPLLFYVASCRITAHFVGQLKSPWHDLTGSGNVEVANACRWTSVGGRRPRPNCRRSRKGRGRGGDGGLGRLLRLNTELSFALFLDSCGTLLASVFVEDFLIDAIVSVIWCCHQTLKSKVASVASAICAICVICLSLIRSSVGKDISSDYIMKKNNEVLAKMFAFGFVLHST